MRIIGIVCVSKNWAIGKNNSLLFNIKEDMAFFKRKTTNNIVFMGLNTYRSIGKPLKNRDNIVVAPQNTNIHGCKIVQSIDDVLNLVKAVNNEETREYSKYIDLYVIGGGMLYKSMLPYYDKVYVTKVDTEVLDADTYFPNLDLLKNEFTISDESDIIISEHGDKFKFTTYVRNKK